VRRPRTVSYVRTGVRPGLAALAFASVGILAVGCSSSGAHATPPTTATGSAATGNASAATGSTGEATVTGAFGTQPTITPSAGQPPAKTEVKVISRGTGRPLAAGDLAVVDDYARTWKSATAFQNTFVATTPPDAFPIGTGKLGLPGLDKALVGVPAGSRVLVVLPPADGFANVTSLPTGVSKTDTALFVFDVRDGYAGNAGPSGTTAVSPSPGLPVVSGPANAKPTITIPNTPAPTALAVSTVIQGNGPVVAKGDELIAQYVGQIWASHKEFDASWTRSSPVGFPIGTGQLIPAWDQALVGVKVGSRMLIIAPPASGYGAAGQPSAGISGTDTLVFVIDILGTYAS
jgi:peptidylprolyl isomerase